MLVLIANGRPLAPVYPDTNVHEVKGPDFYLFYKCIPMLSILLLVFLNAYSYIE